MKTFHLHNLSSKFLGKIPLRIIFTVPFLIELFIIVGLVGVLSYRNGKEAVNDVTAQLRQEITLNIQKYIEQELSALAIINEFNADAIKRLDITLELNDNNPKREYYLWQMIQKFDHVGWIYFSSQEMGQFLGVYRKPDTGELRFSVINSSTNYRTFDYAINSQGQRTKLMQKFTVRYDARKRPWYIESVKAGKPYWVPIYAGIDYDTYFLDLCQPIYDQNNNLLGVIGFSYQLDHIQNFLSKLKISDHGQTFIFDREGLLVASSTKERSLNTTQGSKKKERPSIEQSSNPVIQATAKYLKSNFADFNQIKPNQSYQLEFNYKNERQFVQIFRYQDKLGLDFFIVAVVPEADFMEHIYGNTQQTIFLCFMAFVLVIILGIFTANWVTKPIVIIKKAAKSIAEGKLHQSVEINQTYELVELATSFNKMADRLEESFENLEDKVKQRTVELAEANQEIVALNQRLKADNIRMSTELDITKQLQQMVLPKPAELASITDLDISGFMQTADEVGGDYYDVLASDGQVTIGIGDVTGHGLESGLLMLMTQAAATTLQASEETDHIKFLNVVNRAIYRNTQRINSEKTLSLAFLNYREGVLTITGQHEQVIIVRNDGEVEQIDTDALGFPIGLEAEINAFIATEQVLLNKGDVVVLYTDGITEAENMEKQQYGLEQLIEVVKENSQKSATEIQEEVIDNLREFIGQQKVFDDITLVVLKRK